MTPRQYQYYSFMESTRRSALYASLISQAISTIRAAIHVAGTDPRDPSLSKYWTLISEDGQKQLIAEWESLNLTFEDDSVPDAASANNSTGV